ncbi:helix-turn-helix domain-containing protein [Methylobacter sp. S3L5C]|uniref:helix-turn-helix domain-containing protein n=1 Tax=Methylobacter sp. S3L5C TaxID=2839024 RepID=UPI001FAE6CF7|nr:helix-turn-helix domain-containing protein [Methylobacter sp. S3L5C]
MSYKHLRPEEKHYIEIELKKGIPQNQIAKSLGRNQSSLSRELSRNKDQRGYRFGAI